ncbi:hypothetical protein L1887_11156 [Cichorium endivia]|nr:hypothetical protein L1887_11156 [Cichorium endivia]
MSVNILLASLTSQYNSFIQMYPKRDQHKTFMEMHSMLTLYESFMEMHSSGLSLVLKRIRKPSRSVLRCLKLGIHRVGYSHRKIGRCSKVKQFGNSGTQ